MPRVLRILNRLIIGGPAINATYLTKHMAPDWETMLVIGGKDDGEQDATHLTERLGLQPVVVPEMKRDINYSADRAAYLKVKALIKEFKPDVVHTHAAKSGAIGRLAASACKVPVIVHTFHGHVFHSYFGKMKTRAFIGAERFLARRSDGIIAISPRQKEELSQIYRICPASKIAVIPLGLDLDIFNSGEEEKRAGFRKRFGIAPDEIAIGIIGRIVPVKNHALFAEAAGLLVKKTARRVRFIIIGDGDMRPALENALAAAGVSYAYAPNGYSGDAQAICTSWQTAMDEVLAGLDIVALSSHNEGTPLSLIEAQAAGRPVVSTNVGGVMDVVSEGSTGLIVPPGDAPSFAHALFKLTEEESLRKQFAEAGRATAIQRFSYQRLVGDMDHYYRGLLAKVSRK